MPRPLWAGAISFGLVTIPVKIVSATEDHDVHFHRVHLADMGRVRTRKVCELDGEVVSQDEIGKGYEIAKDETVPVTDEELEQMPLPTAKAIEIAAFVDADTIDPVRISDSYYLAADGQVAAKPYCGAALVVLVDQVAEASVPVLRGRRPAGQPVPMDKVGTEGTVFRNECRAQPLGIGGATPARRDLISQSLQSLRFSHDSLEPWRVANFHGLLLQGRKKDLSGADGLRPLPQSLIISAGQAAPWVPIRD
ncbi:non-homologous end joining protein Ku [Streptomyces sp. NPDC004778]